MEEDRKSMFYVQVFVPVPVVCLYKVVYGRLMDVKTWPLFSLYILRFIYFQKVFIPALNPLLCSLFYYETILIFMIEAFFLSGQVVQSS